MSIYFNHPTYPRLSNENPEEGEPKSDEMEGDDHGPEPQGGEAIQSLVKDYDHPILSPKGLKRTLNMRREYTNSDKIMKGDIDPKTIIDMIKAARKNKFPIELIIQAMDWEKDLDQRKDGNDAEEIIKKLNKFANGLRGSLGRDPLFSEIFGAFAVGSDSKMKQIHDDARDKPEEKAKAPGTKKDDILVKKLENKKPVDRTNRELYDFFHKRMGIGRRFFSDKIGMGADGK